MLPGLWGPWLEQDCMGRRGRDLGSWGRGLPWRPAACGPIRGLACLAGKGRVSSSSLGSFPAGLEP